MTSTFPSDDHFPQHMRSWTSFQRTTFAKSLIFYNYHPEKFLVCSLGKGPKKSVKENWSLRNLLVLHPYVSILPCCKSFSIVGKISFLFWHVSLMWVYSFTPRLTQSHTNGNFCISNQQGPKWTKKECLYFIWIRNAETPFRIFYPLSYIHFSEDSTDFVEQGVLFTDTVYW